MICLTMLENVNPNVIVSNHAAAKLMSSEFPGRTAFGEVAESSAPAIGKRPAPLSIVAAAPIPFNYWYPIL
jgi:hypothetical protein